MFSIPMIDELSEAELEIVVLDWLRKDIEKSVDIVSLEQAFNFSLPRTIFLKNFAAGASIMDVGAGEGSLINYKSWPYFERKDLKLYALSLSKGPFFDQYESFELKNFEEDQNLFPGVTFDGMVCCHFIEHMSDPTNSIRFFSERIGKNGRLFLEWPHPFTKKLPGRDRLKEHGFETTTINFFDDGTHVEAWDAAQVISMLEEAGFSVETGGRVYIPWLADQLKQFAKEDSDPTRTTMALWAYFGWAQYLIATKT